MLIRPAGVAPRARLEPLTVQRGDSGPWVSFLQQHLIRRGVDLEVDGRFGPATDEAARTFQQARGLAVDGVVGPDTWALVSGPAELAIVRPDGLGPLTSAPQPTRP